MNLQEFKSVGCLFVFNNPEFYMDSGKTVLESITYLAERMSHFSGISPTKLIDGGNLNKQILLKCPVTGQQVVFEDFEAIACCPQAANKADPLYDPFIRAPYACVNMNSDIFGFAMLVRDKCLAEYGCEVFEIPDPEKIYKLLAKCQRLWQGLGIKTLKNYIEATWRGDKEAIMQTG